MASAHRHHWRSAADALAALRAEPGLTRAALGDRLGLDSGPTSDLVKRLSSAELISEQRAAPTGRGRPTTTLHASPDGPVAAVLDLRHGDWRLGTSGVDGVVDHVDAGQHGGRLEEVLQVLRARIRVLAGELGDRLVGLGVAVPGPTADRRLVHATMLGWRDVDLTAVLPDFDLPLVVANDATVAAVAESRLHSPRPRALAHVVLEVGVGGALIVGGRPVASAHGLQGEFGHLPFGDPGASCPCGARGCWTVAFAVAQIAEACRAGLPGDPRGWLRRLFTDPAATADVRRVRTALAVELARGIAGLINALDPDVVTLGGLAAELRAAAPEQFEETLRAGLMTVHRGRPPGVVAARGGEDAALIGLGLSVFDQVLDADALARWAGRDRVRR